MLTMLYMLRRNLYDRRDNFVLHPRKRSEIDETLRDVATMLDREIGRLA